MNAEECFSFRALWAAAQRAARGKRRRASVAWFRLVQEDHLVTLRDDLLAGTWRPARPVLMVVHDPKERTISVAPFRDRVVHQAIGAVLGPRIERRLISDTYASRVGLGTHAAMRRARSWARTFEWYAHLDVAKFFPSIDHAIVRAQLARDVPESWLREVCERILSAGETTPQRWHFPGDDLFTPFQREVGLPLGNLTSQLWANRYLDPVDHLVKDRLRVRPYLRYMDDMLVFGRRREEVVAVARRIESACLGLRLRLHAWEALPTRGGVSFVGYRVLRGHVRLRGTGVVRAEHRLLRAMAQAERGERDPAEVWGSLRSTFAHWSHGDTWRLKERLLRRLGLLYAPDEDLDAREP